MAKHNFSLAMSEANKLILEKANSAIVTGDYEGFLTFCTEDTAWTFEGDTALEGKEAVRRWMQTSYNAPPDFKVDRMIADGDFVVALGEIMVAGEQGDRVWHYYCDVWRFRDRKLAELRAFVIKKVESERTV